MTKPDRETAPVALFGPYPPPLGGNSIHVERLYRALRGRAIKSCVIDAYGSPGTADSLDDVYRFHGSKLLRLLRAGLRLRRLKPGLVHVHVSALRNFSLASIWLDACIPRGTTKAITIHSGSLGASLEGMDVVRKALTLRSLSNYDKIITVNTGQKKLLQDNGIDAARIRVIPGYLAPETPVGSPEVHKLVSRLTDQGRKLICVSGCGVPLYGFEDVLSAIKDDRQLAQSCSLIVCVYDRVDQAYLGGVHRALQELPSAEMVMDLGSDDFNYVLTHSQVYTRCTDRDGDALTIREAGDLGAHVVATDVVERPDYCHLYTRGDTSSLAAELRACLAAGNFGTPLGSGSLENLEQLLNFLGLR